MEDHFVAWGVVTSFSLPTVTVCTLSCDIVDGEQK